jgi:hypothetical protein
MHKFIQAKADSYSPEEFKTLKWNQFLNEIAKFHYNTAVLLSTMLSESPSNDSNIQEQTLSNSVESIQPKYTNFLLGGQ